MRTFKELKIAVAGTGYVGLSIAVLLSQHHTVTAVDIIPEQVEKINRQIPPIRDEYIEKYFSEKRLNLTTTTDATSAYKDADFVVIATPTNYDSQKNFFDTSTVESVIELVLKVNPKAVIVIKSTIPVGYTASIRKKYRIANLLFSPEFLRESKALYDNLYPSRIIVGTDDTDPFLAKAITAITGTNPAPTNFSTKAIAPNYTLRYDLSSRSNALEGRLIDSTIIVP